MKIVKAVYNGNQHVFLVLFGTSLSKVEVIIADIFLVFTITILCLTGL